MSTPIGHPDYQNFAITKSDNLFSSFTTVIPPGTVNTAIIPVTSWSSLALNMRCSTGQAKITVTHFADLAGTLIIGSDTWFLRTTCKLNVITPLRGPFVQITTQVTGGVNLTVLQFCAFLSAPAQRISFPVGFQSAGVNVRALPASSSDFWNLPTICAGNASLIFAPSDALAKLHVRVGAFDETGTLLFYVADFGFPAALINQSLQIPDVTIALEIDNIDAGGPHSYGSTLMVPPQ